MSSLLNFAAGAGGGYLAGGPIGAGLGALQGIFGGDDRQTTSYQLRPLTAGQKKIAEAIEAAAPGLIARLSPAGQQKLLNEFEAAYRKMADESIKEAFDPARSRFFSGMSRTGLGPASVLRDATAKFAYEEGRARDTARAGAKINAQSALSAAVGRDQNSFAALLGNLQAMYNGQAVGASATTTMPGSNFNNIMGGAGYALTSPYSYYARSDSMKKYGGGWNPNGVNPVSGNNQGSAVPDYLVT